jgi:hypothetical protein
MFARFRLLILPVVIVASIVRPIDARQAGSLRVRVTDAQQLALPGAACSLIVPSQANPPRANEPVTVTTDERGVALFENVSPGAYTLRIELDGFEPFVRSGLVISSGPTTDQEVVLGLARMTQSVTVAAPVTEDASVSAGSAPPAATIDRRTLQRLPLATRSVKEALPLVPGVVRSDTGELSFEGASEEQSGLRVNGLNAADPATGEFRLSLPVDAVEAVQVFLHPHSAEYGQFTGGLTQVETRAGSDRWHFELNDFLPDMRFINGTIVGVREDAPHLNLSGPLFSKRLFVSQSASYTIAKRPVRGLEFPVNETRTEAQSYFTQLDFSLRDGHKQTVTIGYAPERRDYVGLDVFRPQPTTPSTRQRAALLTARDNSQVLGGLLTSAVAVSRFDTAVWGRGTQDLTLTPTAEAGNYFASQDRRSVRVELLELYALPTKHWLHGSHDIKFGLDLNSSSSRLDYRARPVDVTRADGTLAERIEFDAASRIHNTNQENVGFVQDRWSVTDHLAFDLGVRYEDQRIADATLFAPRAGFAWSPPADGSTVIRGGVGLFFDKVPLNTRSFPQYPARTVTRYAADGVTVLERRRYTNVLVDAAGGQDVTLARATSDATEFVPQSLTWNLQLDRTFRPWLAARANIVSSHSENLYVVQPRVLPDGRGVIELGSTGASSYRAFEMSGRFGPVGRGINVSYTRSRARGDLNGFASAFGDLASPLVRPNQYSQSPVDVPHRLIGWGTIALPRRVTLAPVVEARSGFPYSVRDEAQYFVGVRNADTTRFPPFFAIDLEVAKELQVTRKYAVRLSLRGFNLTNHFNPRDVHANTADPAFGRFLASYRRYFAAGFDIVF